MFEIIFVPLLQIILTCLRMYRFFIFVYILISLLLSFNMLNRNSLFIYKFQSFLTQMIEPVLSPIKRILPRFGMFDFSPIILLLGLQFLMGVIQMTLLKYFNG